MLLPYRPGVDLGANIYRCLRDGRRKARCAGRRLAGSASDVHPGQDLRFGVGGAAEAVAGGVRRTLFTEPASERLVIQVAPGSGLLLSGSSVHGRRLAIAPCR